MNRIFLLRPPCVGARYLPFQGGTEAGAYALATHVCPKVKRRIRNYVAMYIGGKRSKRRTGYVAPHPRPLTASRQQIPPRAPTPAAKVKQHTSVPELADQTRSSLQTLA